MSLVKHSVTVAHNTKCKLTAVKTEVSAASVCDNDVTQ